MSARSAAKQRRPGAGEAAAQQALRPPLKWAGGKRWLSPRLRELFALAPSSRLVEPFCGGLSVSLALSPARALLNDINPHAVNFYQQLQRGLRARIPMRNEEALYYAHRSEFNRLVAGRGTRTAKAAQLFYYLNRTGFNGLCRFNSEGEFNVPYGRYSRINYTREFSAYRPVLARWRFSCGDFQTLRLKHTDFVYADPPYDVQFRNYSRQGFEFQEQERLVKWLAAHPGPVVLSNQATTRIIELYRDHGFSLYRLHAPRMIACNGDRRPALEVLALRNLNQVHQVRKDRVLLRRR